MRSHWSKTIHILAPAVETIVALFLFLSSTEVFPGSETERLEKENIFLKSEYALSASSRVYVVFNLFEKKVLLKAHGMVLKEFPLQCYTLWGKPVRPESLTLMKKGGLTKLKRKKVKPLKNGEGEGSELDYLRVEEMPSRYRLKLNGSIWVFVAPKPSGLFSRILDSLFRIEEALFTRPFGALWYALWGKDFTEINIYMDTNGAKSLFWCLQEGHRCLVYD